jgi:hypothetical protein
VERTIRGIHDHDGVPSEDEPRGPGPAELRVAVLVEDVLGNPNEDARFDLPDFVATAGSVKAAGDR